MSTTVRNAPAYSVSKITSPKILKSYFKRNSLSFRVTLLNGSQRTVSVKLARLSDRLFRKTKVLTLGGHSRRFTERSLTRQLPSETGVNLAQKVLFLETYVSPAMGCPVTLVKREEKLEPTLVQKLPQSLPDADSDSICSLESTCSYTSVTTLEDYMEEGTGAEVERSTSDPKKVVEDSISKTAAKRGPARSLNTRRLHSKLRVMFACNLKRYDNGRPFKKIKWDQLPPADTVEDIAALKVLAKEYNKLAAGYEAKRLAKKVTSGAKDAIDGLQETKKEIEEAKKSARREVIIILGTEAGKVAWKHRDTLYRAYKKAPRFQKTKQKASRGVSVLGETISEGIAPASAVLTCGATLVAANQDIFFKGAKKYLAAKKTIKSTQTEIKEYNEVSDEITKEKRLADIAAKRADIEKTQEAILELLT